MRCCVGILAPESLSETNSFRAKRKNPSNILWSSRLALLRCQRGAQRSRLNAQSAFSIGRQIQHLLHFPCAATRSFLNQFFSRNGVKRNDDPVSTLRYHRPVPSILRD